MKLYLFIVILIMGLMVLPVLSAETFLTDIEPNVTIIPNATPLITLTPTAGPTSGPTVNPPVEITILPTLEPTSVAIPPTVKPTENITPIPTLKPTAEPTSFITVTPTEEISIIPTVKPTTNESEKPVPDVTLAPSVQSPIIALSLSGNFSFISSPSGAAVTFNGAEVGSTPVTVAVDETGVPPYAVTMRKTGYLDWTSSINHNPNPGTTETISATLQSQPANGSISVSSTPSGATVGLDGTDIQTTPHTYPEVTVGSHTITVSKDGYSPYSTTVTVASGAQSVISATLSPVSTTGSLTVETDPSGAVILLNGIVYGVTPSHFSAIPVGSYTLQLVKYGYEPVAKTIQISSGQENTVQISLPRRIPPTGTLLIRSFPSGGVVTLDGDTRGITPVRIPGLHPDSYNVRVSIPGYLSWIGIVEVIGGRETSIYATLSPKGTVTNTGSLSVQSTPAGASVSVDSMPQGKTPINILNMAEGTHSLVIAYPGYEPVTTTAMVQPGKTTVISVTLTPYQAVNLSPALITLSEDAAAYFITHGRSQSLVDFDRQDSGFTMNNRYVITLDLNGTVLSDGINSDLIGFNLSEQNRNGVSQGSLMTTMARLGGGLLYATNLTEGNGVSLVYVRPAISGVVIAAVTQVQDIAYPEIPGNYDQMQERVHAAVLHAREISREEAEAGIETDASGATSSGVLLHIFDPAITNDIDQNGVSPTRLLKAAGENGGGYIWVPVIDGTSKRSSLMLGYAEKVDDTWGIWASSTGNGHEVIIMMDSIPVQV